ncbi:branched-chain amino acid ABC transporter permease, partial [Bacteroides thetaiotaomicron]|nr:branched-chain amino acid ABC transporter permease [Bacteroides thetaiotaomicron]
MRLYAALSRKDAYFSVIWWRSGRSARGRRYNRPVPIPITMGR